MLTADGREWWPVEKMQYSYRSSALKNGSHSGVILSAEFRLGNGTAESLKTAIEALTAKRKAKPLEIKVKKLLQDQPALMPKLVVLMKVPQSPV